MESDRMDVWDKIKQQKFTNIQAKKARVVNPTSEYFDRIGNIVDRDRDYGGYILDFSPYGKGFCEDELEFIGVCPI